MEPGIYRANSRFNGEEVYLLICEDTENPGYTRVFIEKNKRKVKPNGQWNFSGKLEDYFLFSAIELRETDLKYSMLEKIAELSELEKPFIKEYKIKVQ